MTEFEQGRTDGYQGTVNTYRRIMNPEYTAGVEEGAAFRRRSSSAAG